MISPNRLDAIEVYIKNASLHPSSTTLVITHLCRTAHITPNTSKLDLVLTHSLHLTRMRTLQRITAARPRTTIPLRAIATRAHHTLPPYSWDSSRHTPYSYDDRARSFYSTQIYAGQVSPPNHVRALHSASGGPPDVYEVPQKFGREVKGNPTESEADVAADRSDVDPLRMERHQTIPMGAGGAGPQPTESEEDVMADRGGAGMDPLWGVKRR